MATFAYNTGFCSRFLADLSDRPAIGKTLQRLVAAGDLRHNDRSLYDWTRMNNLNRRRTMCAERQDSSSYRVDGSGRTVESPFLGRHLW